MQYYHAIITTDAERPYEQLPADRKPMVFVERGEDPKRFDTQLLWTNWECLSDLCSRFAPFVRSNFKVNYEPIRDELRIRPTGVPLAIPHGVSLVLLNEALYSPRVRTFVHLSSNGKAFRLRDYSGPVTLEIHPQFTAGELFAAGSIVEQKKYSRDERRRWKDHAWWHDEITRKNQEHWPN